MSQESTGVERPIEATYMVNLLESRDERPRGTVVPASDEDGHAEGKKLDPCLATHGLRSGMRIGLVFFWKRLLVLDRYALFNFFVGNSSNSKILLTHGVACFWLSHVSIYLRCAVGRRVVGEMGYVRLRDVYQRQDTAENFLVSVMSQLENQNCQGRHMVLKLVPSRH